MEKTDLLSTASFWGSAHSHQPSAWSVHIPFVSWLIDATQPALFVQIGQTAGDPYFTFCEAVRRSALKTRCFAVEFDNSFGDGGPPSREVGSSFDIVNAPFHQFSSRLVTAPDYALSTFADRSIDLLHIHGRWRVESLTRVVQTWATKISDRGLVLLDNTNESEPDGAGQLLRELGGRFPTFRFTHGNGLGLIAVGARIPVGIDRHMTSVLSGLLKELSRENAARRREEDDLTNQLNEIRCSLAWIFVQKARNMRAAVFKDGTRRGRCWALSSRFIRTTARSGIRVAVRKAAGKVAKKLVERRSTNDESLSEPLPRIVPSGPGDRFERLPWRFTGTKREGASAQDGHFKLLLVAHSACRTGAPLCLLQFAQELSQIADFDCYIVLQRGGELADSFARIAPTLDIKDLIMQESRSDEIPDLIAACFREFSCRGVAICNTVAVHGFHEAFAAHKVPVLSWVHELPSSIASLGGTTAIERIKAASRRIMVPAEFVREALISKFAIDPALIRTVYYGQTPKTRGPSRTKIRLQVRKELGLPADALIVLGCGTIELRKGADLFVNLARRLLSDRRAEGFASKTWFIWVGCSFDDGVVRWLMHDAGIGDLEDRIRFVGSRTDTSPYFLAADVFALTSREDPCPLVNFEAMESGLAVVAFQGAGGAPEVLGEDGISVPYIDVGAMAQSVLTLLADHGLRTEMGARGQALIRDRFTWARFMDEFLDILKLDFEYRPARRLTVSVIVPNYRHEAYLEERLHSIFNQTLKPDEIIFLDDASPDGSIAVARRLAAESPVPMRIIVNKQNGGSTFRQWMKGLTLATGDLIWLAESDDSCHPEFLERLVPEFYDPDVALCYCQSTLIGPQSEKLADHFLGHTDDISTVRWRDRYCVTGTEEARLALSQKNTIPNASAVLFRRPANLDFAPELESYRFAGDWFFYATLIRTGKIAYVPDVLNHYRRHEQTVTHQSIREETHTLETLSVKTRVFDTFRVPANAMAESLGRTVLEYNQLNERLGLNRAALTANPRLTPALNQIRTTWQDRCGSAHAMRILLVVPDMKPQTQTLANIHLANRLAEEHSVFLCNAHPGDCDPHMVEQLDDRVIRLEGTLARTPWFTEDRADLDCRTRVLRELVQFHQIDLIHSRSLKADRLVHSLKDTLRVPWLIHLDDYRALFDQAGSDPESIRTATEIISSASGLFYARESDAHFFEQFTSLNRKRLFRFANGFHASANRTAALCTKAYVEANSSSRFSTGARTDAPVTSDDRWTPTPHIRLNGARRLSSRRRVPEPLR